jgi:hypothetical protein
MTLKHQPSIFTESANYIERPAPKKLNQGIVLSQKNGATAINRFGLTFSSLLYRLKREVNQYKAQKMSCHYAMKSL